MTCPASSTSDACTNDVPCGLCPRAEVGGTVWEYDRVNGWHEPGGEECE